MTSPTSSNFTQFHSNTHPQHSHRYGSTSSSSSQGSMDYTGPSFSSLTWSTPTSTTRTRRFSTTANEDPFAAQREPQDPMYSGGSADSRRVSEPSTSTPIDRRMSREWDAAKVPPSKFQKPEGSIFATPSSRDGHIARNKIKASLTKVKDKVNHRN